jgi:chaperonin GroES
MLIEAARDVTATKDVLTGEQQANTPVGTTLALIEQGLKVFSAIYKRIHRSLKNELALLYRLNRLYLDDESYFAFQDKKGVVARTDYESKDVDVIPVSDPTAVSDMQRLGRAQFLMEHFRGDPLIDQKELDKRVLEAANVADIDTLFAKQAPPNPEALVEAARMELEHKRLELDDRRLGKEEADSLAKNAKTIGDLVVALANMQKTTTKGPDGETQTTETPLSPQVIQLATLLMGVAGEQLDTKVAEDEVQPGNVPGMEGPPADQGVPGVPEGQPGPVGGEMGGGPPDDALSAGQGTVDGGNGGPGLA